MVSDSKPPALSLDELVDQIFGVRTRPVPNPEINEVGVASVTILRADSTRVAFVIINLSANVIYVAPESAAATDRGIRLNANGGSVKSSALEDFNLPGVQWSAIATGANSDVYTVATVIEPR